MTNADYYLKEGVDIGELARNLGFFLENTIEFSWQDSIVDYFKQNAKPTLTEDERVILRNINCRYNRIRKVKEPDHLQLQIFDKYDKVWEIFTFNHLFQFIKDGEEYSIEELLNND